MSGTAAIAIYAAIIATAGLGWQIYIWRRTHTSQVQVKLTNAFLTPSGEHVAMISAVNRSNHAVHVDSVGLLMQDGSKRDYVLFGPPMGATLPGTVNPRDSGKAWFSVVEMTQNGLDVYRPLTAWVNTAEGDRFSSPEVTLMRH
jgi:hypothetical protein